MKPLAWKNFLLSLHTLHDGLDKMSLPVEQEISRLHASLETETDENEDDSLGERLETLRSVQDLLQECASSMAIAITLVEREASKG